MTRVLQPGEFPDVMTLAEVADKLRVCKRTVMRKIAIGRLPLEPMYDLTRVHPRFRGNDVKAYCAREAAKKKRAGMRAA